MLGFGENHGNIMEKITKTWEMFSHKTCFCLTNMETSQKPLRPVHLGSTGRWWKFKSQTRPIDRCPHPKVDVNYFTLVHSWDVQRGYYTTYDKLWLWPTTMMFQSIPTEMKIPRVETSDSVLVIFIWRSFCWGGGITVISMGLWQKLQKNMTKKCDRSRSQLFSKMREKETKLLPWCQQVGLLQGQEKDL